MNLEEVVFRFFPWSTVVRFTQHNLDNATPVPPPAFREILKLSGTHDYETQGIGRAEFGVEIPLGLLSRSDDETDLVWHETQLNLYKANPARGERRFWIPGLPRWTDAGERWAIGLGQDGAVAINLSRVPSEDHLHNELRDRTGFGERPPFHEREEVDASSVERATSIVQRIVRDSVLTQRVKEIHGFSCQICEVILVGSNGEPYAEGAHIHPLYAGGPDCLANILCLCPNHHVLLDTGAITISDDLVVTHRRAGHRVGGLRLVPEHEISVDCVRRQRLMFD